MQDKGMDRFVAGTARLYCRRLPATDQLKLCVVGEKKSGRVIWILAGQNAWTKHAPAQQFRPQSLPYRNEDEARADALRIFPSHGDFLRFCEYGFHGETVKDMKSFGPPLDVWSS